MYFEADKKKTFMKIDDPVIQLGLLRDRNETILCVFMTITHQKEPTRISL